MQWPSVLMIVRSKCYGWFSISDSNGPLQLDNVVQFG